MGPLSGLLMAGAPAAQVQRAASVDAPAPAATVVRNSRREGIRSPLLARFERTYHTAIEATMGGPRTSWERGPHPGACMSLLFALTLGLGAVAGPAPGRLIDLGGHRLHLH